MSALARKNVLIQVNSELPEPSETLIVARILSSKGGDIFEVEIPSGVNALATVLALMPSKYMNVVWVKTGDLVLVEKTETVSTSKISYSIAYILNEAQTKHILSINQLPEVFMDAKYQKLQKSSVTNVEVSNRFLNSMPSYDEEDDFDLPANPNHVKRPFDDSSSSEDEED